MSYSQLPQVEGEELSNADAVPWRRSLIALGAVAMVSGGAYFRSSRPASSLATQSSYTSGCLSTKNVAMNGADLVEYFSLAPNSAGVMGSSDYSATYGDDENTYTFYFKDEANLALFKANPTSYLPQFGGFCSWGIAEEDWWTVDTLGPSANTDVWTIIDGKLYFFMFDNPRNKFLGFDTDDTLDASGDTQKYIADANLRWNDWFDGAAAYNTGCYWFDEYTDGK